MTRYYTRVITGLRSFLTAIAAKPNFPNNDHTTINNWLNDVTAAVNGTDMVTTHLNVLAKAVRNAKEALKVSKHGVRTARLGLRMAGIDPRGAYGISGKPKGGGAGDKFKIYTDAVDALQVRLTALLNAIKNVAPATHLPAIDTLLEFAAVTEIPIPAAVVEFRDGLYRHLAKGVVPGNPPGGSQLFSLELAPFVDPPVIPGYSSYWPSSFIASSSSSSATPPP